MAHAPKRTTCYAPRSLIRKLTSLLASIAMGGGKESNTLLGLPHHAPSYGRWKVGHLRCTDSTAVHSRELKHNALFICWHG